jgi:hypothetical protein
MSSGGTLKGGPWHEGEIEVQTRAGVREEADQLTGMYKRQVPTAMAGFLTQQQFAVLSTVDKNRQVWANLVSGTPGMIGVERPDVVALVKERVETELPANDVRNNSQVGLLVIDFSRRIRVRINGNAMVDAGGSIGIGIEELYGNCSQYIQKRVVDMQAERRPSKLVSGIALTQSQTRLIECSDTFFLASRHPQRGADASHRGGKPGFARTESSTTLTFPDYAGNNMFNTLGNIAVNPAIGLLFVDFDSGGVLQISGIATVDWDPERRSQLPMAQRVIDVTINQVREIENAMSLRYRFIGYSPTLE